MSKSSTATVPKTSSQLPSKSAWAKGPPANTSTASSPRPQSPAPSVTSPSAPTTHSRRPSTLGQAVQGVAFKDGARTPTTATKPGSSVTFGSIDDASAPISSSPATVPTIKPEGIKSFGSVPAHPSNGKMHARTTSFSTGTPPSIASAASSSAAPSTASTSASSAAAPSASTLSSTPSRPKFDVKSLFQNKSSDAPSTSTPASASPSTRPAPLPQSSLPPAGQHPHQPSPSQMGAPYGSNFRPPQQNGMPPQSAGVPRSPNFSRQMPNGNVNGRPNGPPNGPPSAALPAAMPSPRLGPPPHPGRPSSVPPGAQVMPQWGYYYYQPGMPMDPNYNPYSPQWMPQHMQPPHHPPQTPVGAPVSGMPISPRVQPPPLHAPGTPTLTPALPPNAHPPHSTPSPHTHTASLSSVASSTPSTPASSNAPGGGLSRLNSNANTFTPKRVVIKSETGQELNFEQFKKQAPAVAPSPIVPSSPARRSVPVRLETEESKRKRLAEEEAKEKAEKAKQEAEEKAKKEAEEKRQAEEEAKREAEEKAKREEEEKRRKEEEETQRKKVEEEERKRKEEERLKKEAEEKARKEAEEAERAAREAEEKAAATAAAEQAKAAPEEGEVEEPEAAEAMDEATKEEAKDKVSDKAPLRIDTALTPSEGKRRPGRLDLSSAKNPAIPAPLPSALATARIIEDIGSIQYPEGIMSPKPELNTNAKQGKFRYDRDFLLQFMAVCKEKPDSLPPLDAIGLEPTDQTFAMTRGGSHGRRTSSSAVPPSRQASVGLGISGFKQPPPNPFTMGQFSTPTQKLATSEERFAASSRSTSMSVNPAGMPFGRPSPMVRSSSQGGPGHSSSGRTRSQRGGKRDKERPGTGQSGQGSSFGPSSNLGPGMLEPVAPLEVSANRWTPASVSKKGPAAVEQDSPEVVDRKVRALLNKLTMERFDSISDQIIEWANKSEKEKDGRTLIQVIRLVFEKATDEATWSEMYARLCRKMMEQISPNVHDDGIKNAEGKPIAGGQLFRKYLLNRCQEDFERGWVAKEATAAAAATKASEDKAAKAAAEKDGGDSTFSEEYYAAQKAKRQGLGLIKFIGELFKLQMLTERIMHECVKKLLGNVENPEEEEIESLCKLLTTVGQSLDTAKARAHMDVYFARMKELTKSPNVNSRMQFMLQDIIELRERKWIPRNAMAAPTTIAALHEQAAKEKVLQEKEAFNRTLSMSRGGSRRGGERGDHSQVGPDGWAVAGGPAARPPPKAGDLSQFGKINKATPMTFLPSSVFQKGDKTKSRESTIRAGSSNMFSMLGQTDITAEVTSGKSSRPPSRKNSIDLGSGGAPDVASGAPPQRKRLQLLPRSVPVEANATPAASTVNSEDEGAESTSGAPSMSEEEAKTRIKEDSKEFMAIRDLNEAEVYFTKLPSEFRHLLVDKLVTQAIESKEADAQLVADLFDRAASKNLCSPASFEEGFTSTIEIIDDIVIDAPKALDLLAKMMRGAHLHTDEERRTRLASKSEFSSDKLLRLLS